MATMMQCYPSKTFVDDTMQPLVAGRLSVYVHDSNVLADIFTLEGTDYVPCANPVRLDEAGRLVASIFTELGVYDVKLEKYNGADTFELFDTYEIGIDAKLDQVGRDSVDTIEDLMALDPTVCSDVVTVMSYPVRNYLWDPNAIDTADGGVVVDSDVSDHGRWLLLWDCPYLPSSVYGVVNGDVTNINALFNYASIIGSMNIHTPPCIRLETGFYDFGGYYICTKHLALEPNVKFSGTIGLYDDLELFGRAEPESNIGDFAFLHDGCSAHSCWFRDINDFWHCGADILYVDNTNHFNSGADKLKQSVSLSGKTVVGAGTKVTEYANGSFFQLALDSTVPDNFFIPNKDFVRVSGTGFGDSVFRAAGAWDPGLINQGHHIQFDLVPDLDLFADTKRWVATMLERRNRLNSAVWSDYTLDLQGRTADSLYLNDKSFTTIKNGAFTGMVTITGYSVTFDNVTAAVMVNSSIGAGITATDSTLTIQRFHTGLSYISTIDSKISVIGSEGIDPCKTSISMRGGSFSGTIRMTTDDLNAYKLNNQIVFRDVFIAGEYNWKLNYIYMVGCTSSSKIDLFPAATGDKFYYNCILQNNQFLGNFRLWITYYYDDDNPHYEVRGTAVKFNTMIITNNRFDGNDLYGVKMTQWHVNYYEPFMYTNYYDTNMGTWRYQGNTGNCPLMCPGIMNNRENWSDTYYDSVPEEMWRKSANPYNLFVPYCYMRGGAMTDYPQTFYDPSEPTQRVLADVHNDDFGNDWAYVSVWHANGVSTPENMKDENYNNRFLTYVYIGREKDTVPNYHTTGEGKFAFTTFALPSRHA